jgi:hypothetical protein
LQRDRAVQPSTQKLTRDEVPILQLFDDGSDGQLRRLIGIYAVLIAANLLAWTWTSAELSRRPTPLDTALLAYIPADQIAAIDNWSANSCRPDSGRCPSASSFRSAIP